jgi:predicted dehydrogenase
MPPLTSPPRKIRTAIVGLGFGAEFIPIHQRHPHAQLVAICQRSQEKLDQIGKAHGELLAVIAMAAETNRLAEALRVPVDEGFSGTR